MTEISNLGNKAIDRDGSAPRGLAGISKAHGIIHHGSDGYWMTDLTKTAFAGVQNKLFRLFSPVKHDRMRLPTSLPEFRNFRHRATLSDSPVIAAAKLGGHWCEHNLAAITHVAACNLRCSYCYVDYGHLGGRDAFACTPDRLVDEFDSMRRELERRGLRLTILRLSGGEPLLAPGLVAEVDEALRQRGLVDACVLKVESNLTGLRWAFDRLAPEHQASFRQTARRIVVHATLHARPGQRDWENVRDGLRFAVELGIDVYPAIGGADWTEDDMSELYTELVHAHPNLPYRLAVRPFNLDYVEGRTRHNLPSNVHGPRTASEAWETILRARGGDTVSYLARPRHMIELA
jgi:uncharacterized Fe-S cluster-containing radical SAM superfamily protein